MADTAEPAPLRAELMAAAVVAALRLVIDLFTANTANGNGTTIVAFRSDQDIDALIPALRRLTEDQPAT